MRFFSKSLIVVLIILVGFISIASGVSAQEPIIRAVLLYSPSCPHCLDVINEILPPLVEQYGTSQLQIFGVSTYTDTGHNLFVNASEVFNIPEDRQAVPTMIIGDHVMVGSREISELLPGLIEQGISNGGVDWPPIPGLEEAMQDDGSGAENDTSTINHKVSLKDRFTADLAGNILAVIVLIGMLGAMVYSGISLYRGNQEGTLFSAGWLVPILSIVGIGVAGYLSYVEFNQVEAVCGPVGNCNTVQQSSYARLFGIIPIGFLGILGYLAIIILWLVEVLDLPSIRQYARLGLWIITLIGTLFSIYLTFLEPFVIGATCMWCLTSAILMTVLYLISTRKLGSTFEEAEY